MSRPEIPPPSEVGKNPSGKREATHADREADEPSRPSIGPPGGGVFTAEARYRALVEQIPAITFVAALDDGIQEFYVSPQIETMLGFTQKEWLENPILWYQQLHPEDRDRWQAEFALTVFGGTAFRSEYRFLARDGHVVWVRGEAQMVRDAEGNPLFLQGVAFDITEQKEAEAILRRSREHLEEEVVKRTWELGESNRALQTEAAERTRADLALRDREARLRSIVECAVDGILVIDRRGIVETFNPAAERIFGYSATEVIGQNVCMLMPAPYRDEHDGYMQRFLETGIRKVIGIGRDVFGRRKDGSTFPMELGVSETPTPEGIKFTGFVRDVTDRKRTEAALVEAKLAAEAASKLKGEFLANMSHEIRTPMNGIIGMTELDLDTELAPDQREYLEMVISSADSLLAILNDVLDFSKIEAGKLDLDSTDFDLREMLFDALRLIAVRAYEKGLELVCDVDPDVPDVLVGDPGRLRQILINLVGNSMKFTSRGEIVLHVGREVGPGKLDNSLRFSVRDTAIGIPEEKQHLIFESFTQADGSTTRKFGGTGLGLAISRNLVGMMGGRIWLESVPGLGSTFHFTATLPASSIGPFAISREGTPELTGIRVLIADDNSACLNILGKFATGWGMEPTLCATGTVAMRAMMRAVDDGRPFSIVVLDAMMPGIAGFDAICRIDADASPAATMIMMLPSAGQMSDLGPVKGNGPGLCLIKPVRQSELLGIFRTVLSPAARPIRVESKARTNHEAASPSSLRILLAEDSVVNQRVAVRFLEKQGHQVMVAGDGKQALDILMASPFDLVIMDVQMPVMDGFEATAALRAWETQTGGHLPVIALTANAMKGDREICLLAGFDDYITKPIRWPLLAAAIEAQTPTSMRIDAAKPRKV